MGIDLLTTNGLLTFIAQNNWVTNFGAEKMRNKVVTDTKIINITDFNHYMIFETADIQTSVMIFQKNNHTKVYDFDFRKLHPNNSNYSHVLDILHGVKANNILYRPKFIRKSYLNKYLLFNEEHVENILFKVLDKGNFNLTNKEVGQGIVFPQDYLNSKNEAKVNNGTKGDGIFVLTEEEVKKLNIQKSEYSLLKPFYDSKRLKLFYGNKNFKPKKYIIYTDSSFKNKQKMSSYPNLKRHLDKYSGVITSDNKPYGLHRSREEDFFKGEKVISLRKCSDRPTFTFTDFDCYVSATFFVIKSNRINQRYLTGLLNSNLFRFWFKYKGKMQGTNFQIDKQPLLDVPILKTENKHTNKIIEIVDKILSIKSKNIETSIIELKLELDTIIYKLYEISYKDILTIDPEFSLTQDEYNTYQIE